MHISAVPIVGAENFHFKFCRFVLFDEDNFFYLQHLLLKIRNKKKDIARQLHM